MAYSQSAGILEVAGEDDSSRRTWLPVDQAEALFRPEGGFMRVAHLSRCGIGAGPREVLFASGLLQPIVPREGFSQKLCPPIRVKDVAELMNRFLCCAEPIEKPGPAMVGLHYISKEMPGVLATVHELILAKSIWVGKLVAEPRAYASILVSLEQIRSLVTPDLMNTQEFSKATKIHYSLVVAMAEAGDVESVIARNPAGRLVRRNFCRSDVENVRSEFIDLTELAKLHKRRPGTVLARLTEIGVLPLYTARDGDGEYRIYRKRDLDALTL